MFKSMIVLTLLAFGSQGFQDTNDDCNRLGILFYEDIGCRPVTVEGKKCPVRFECDDFALKKDTCLFKSKIFKVGETIDEALTISKCKAKCSCNAEQRRQNGMFSCLSPVCPRYDGEQQRGCYQAKINLDKCCNDKTICPNDGHVQCHWIDGSTYDEGSMMTQNSYSNCDKSGCSDCVCRKGFDGKLVEPFCKRRTCLVQLEHSDKLAQNCAPVYFGKSYEDCNLCCPQAFVCPKDTDTFERIDENNEDTGHKCKFGDHTVKPGDDVKTTVVYGGRGDATNVTCRCILPPFLTCRNSN